MLELKNINNEIEYLSSMVKSVKDGKLEIARFIDELCYVTSTKEECNKIESVNIYLNESMIDHLLNEYNNIIDTLLNIKNEIELNNFISTFSDGYKKERFITQLKRVHRVYELNAPLLIKQNEKIMLLDFFVLYKTVL